MFEQTVKPCGDCLHPAAAILIEEKCFTQKMHLKQTFQSLTSAPVAGCILGAITLLWPKMQPAMHQVAVCKGRQEEP